MTKLFCSCNEFINGIKEINDAIDFFRNHATEYEYNTIPFKFCPWCGKELKDETTLTCDLIIADQPTVNNRIYSKEIMQKITDEFNKKEHKLGQLSGNADENNSYDIKLCSVSHKCKNLRINSENKFEADVIPIGSQGETLKELIKKNKDQLQLFPRIIGVIDENNQVSEVANVISFDIINK